MCREINHLVVDGVEDVWGVDVEALGRELVRMGAQERGQLLPAIARPNVPHRARATVAAAKKPRSLNYLLAAAPTLPPLFHRHFFSRKNGTGDENARLWSANLHCSKACKVPASVENVISATFKPQKDDDLIGYPLLRSLSTRMHASSRSRLGACTWDRRLCLRACRRSG